MDFRVIVLFSMTAIFFGFWLLILLKGPGQILNRVFSIFVINMALWSFGLGMFYKSQSPQASLFWTNVLYLAGSLIPAAFLHFSFVFPSGKMSISRFKQFLIYVPNIILFYLFFFTPIIVRGVTLPGQPKGFIYGPGHILWDLQFDTIFAWAFVRFCMAYKSCTGVVKMRLRYVILGTLIGVILAGITNVIMPWFNRFELLWLAPPFTLTWLVGITYAILKYRLMDIKLARQYLAIYFFYGLIGLVLFILPILLLRHSVIGIIFLVVVAFLAAPRLYRWTAKFLEPAFLGESYRTWQGLDKLKDTELGYISEQIAWNLVGGISEIMQVDRISFFMFVANRKEFRPYAQIGLDEEIGTEAIPWVTLSFDNHLVKHLSETKQLVIKDDVPGANSLAEEMQRLYVEISVPLFVKDELIGILNLGSKPNKDMYHQEELKKLTDLCHQAENHLSHTRFMEKRATFSRELAHYMKNLVVKAIEPTFAELCETKDEKKKQEIIRTLFNQHQYLKICLQDNFDLSSLLERLVYHRYILEPGQIAKVISVCASFYKDSFTKAGLSIELDLPKNLPLVLVNKEDIPKVFNNLFDNALKFTLSGGKIKIKAEQKEDEVLVTFSDTGRGISEGNLKTIFEPKVKMPDDDEAVGTGLGLVIVKDIIEAHKGRIWVESPKGNGTTFFFIFCISKENNKNNEEV